MVTTLTLSKVSDQPCRCVNPAVYSFQDEEFSEWESPFDVLQNMRQSFDCHYNLPWQVRTYTVFPYNHQVMWLFYSICQPLEVFTWHCSFNCIIFLFFFFWISVRHRGQDDGWCICWLIASHNCPSVSLCFLNIVVNFPIFFHSCSLMAYTLISFH